MKTRVLAVLLTLQIVGQCFALPEAPEPSLSAEQVLAISRKVLGKKCRQSHTCGNGLMPDAAIPSAILHRYGLPRSSKRLGRILLVQYLHRSEDGCAAAIRTPDVSRDYGNPSRNRWERPCPPLDSEVVDLTRDQLAAFEPALARIADDQSIIRETFRFSLSGFARTFSV